uniref:Netrin module non-TIMP type domain-containing protein n=1 Tax=Neolamprologus brichardi TaxID=32507 RepID=A0A3Q4I9J4_NEOBR
HPQREAGKLLQLCRDNICTCAEGKHNHIHVIRKAYFTTVIKMFSCIFLLTLNGTEYSIRSVIKVKRIFLSYQHCREALSLEQGKTYLIMEYVSILFVWLFEYVIGERTWVEYWPTAEECQTDKYRDTCLGLEEMVNHLWWLINFSNF